jgi:hypothetical protein
MVRCLVKKLQADVNQAGQDGILPLWRAVVVGDLEMARCLVQELHADLKKADDQGDTPIWAAATKGNLAMLQCRAWSRSLALMSTKWRLPAAQARVTFCYGKGSGQRAWC